MMICCFILLEYWKGYLLYFFVVLGIFVFFINLIVKCFVFFVDFFWCLMMIFEICELIVLIGFSEVIGFWKIVVIFFF